MFTSVSERVVPRYNPRGLIPLAILLGAAWGEVYRHLTNDLAYWLAMRFSGPVSGIVMLHVAVLPFVVLAALQSRVDASKKRTALLAVVFGGAWVLWMLLATLAREPGLGVDSPEVLDIGTLLVFPAVMGGGVLVALLTRWLMRRVTATPVEQTDPPRLCWWCAYDVGPVNPETARVCPECGKAQTPSAPRSMWLSRSLAAVQRWVGSRAAVAALAGVVLGVGGWMVVTRAIPAWRFVRAFDRVDAAGRKGSNRTYAHIDMPWSSETPAAIGRTVPMQDGTNRMLLVSYNPAPRTEWGTGIGVSGGTPKMQVRVCAPEPPLPGLAEDYPFTFANWGTCQVVADLNAEQARWVIDNGIPDSLKAALAARADAVKWAPNGTIQGSGPRETVDPAPHIPSVP